MVVNLTVLLALSVILWGMPVGGVELWTTKVIAEYYTTLLYDCEKKNSGTIL